MIKKTQNVRDGVHDDRGSLLEQLTVTDAESNGILGRGLRININATPGYPGRISLTRLFKDERDAAAVQELLGEVLHWCTDGYIYSDDGGTFLVSAPSVQYEMWESKNNDAGSLFALVPLINRWAEDRTKAVKSQRAREKRIAESDAAIDELGYSNLRKILLGLAGSKQRELLITDPAGHGGTLSIPARTDLIPAGVRPNATNEMPRTMTWS